MKNWLFQGLGSPSALPKGTYVPYWHEILGTNDIWHLGEHKSVKMKSSNFRTRGFVLQMIVSSPHFTDKEPRLREWKQLAMFVKEVGSGPQCFPAELSLVYSLPPQQTIYLIVHVSFLQCFRFRQ